MKEPLEGTMSEKEWRGMGGEKEKYEKRKDEMLPRGRNKSKEKYIMLHKAACSRKKKRAFDEFDLPLSLTNRLCVSTFNLGS